MDRWRSVCLLLSVWCVALLGPSFPLFFQGRELAFRDAGHYYPPYLRMVRESWSDGPPLWNHFEERGRPLMADPTAAVFYPGSLLFLLPIRFELLWTTYLAAHLLIAAAGGYRAARRWQLAEAPAALASLGYACGGQVLFQVHNLPYLVGAAWLPWVLTSVIRLLEPEPRDSPAANIARVAIPIALIVLAGDLQTAYLAGLASLFACLCDWWRPAAIDTGVRRTPRPAASLLLVSAGVVLGLALSAIQWLPTWHWSQQSARWTLAADIASDARSSTNATPDGSPFEIAAAQQRFDYSVGPWRWLELIVPNASGHFTPAFTRWSTALPFESRAWSPSLYMGLPVLGLALLSLGRRGDGDWRSIWLRGLALFGVAGSLGRYGLHWLFAWKATAEPAIDAWGGLYWALTECLPGFHVFRYPAKLWVWTSLAMSLLAASEMQRWFSAHDNSTTACDVATGSSRARARLSRLLGSFAIVGLLAGAFLWLLAAPNGWLVRSTPADAIFGPLDAAALRRLLVQSTIHVLLVCTACWIWLGCQWPQRAWSGWLLVAVTAVDLTAAHRHLLPTVPRGTLPPHLASYTPRPAGDFPVVRYLRSPAGAWYPRSWSLHASPERLKDVVQWDAATLRPKYHLDESLCSVRSATSFSSKSHLGLLALLDQLAAQRDPAWHELLRVLGCQFVVLRSEDDWIRWPTEATPAAYPEACVARIPDPFPRAWIVHDRAPIEAGSAREAIDVSRGSVATWQRWLYQRWIVANRLSRFRSTVFLDDAAIEPSTSDAIAAPNDASPESARDKDTTCELVGQSTRSLAMRIQSSRPGWLVLNDSFDAGWQATVAQGTNTWQSPVHRANDLMMAIEVPAGESRVSWTYQAPGYSLGKTLTAAATLILATIAARTRWPRRHAPDAVHPEGTVH